MPRKRRRVDSCGNPNIELSLPLEDLLNLSANLPAPDVLEEVVNVYFNNIQPWIPILHETQFRKRIHDPSQRPRLIVILHAMIVAALRLVGRPSVSLTAQEIQARTLKSRNIVVLTAMDELAVENLQALVIVAFTDVGSPLSSRFGTSSNSGRSDTEMPQRRGLS
jgi:hypothetical protein